MTSPHNYLPNVRDQYENLPYPPREPEDERKRLITTWLDDLPMVNHYCFGGKQSFRDTFRVLVAGGGTGDGTIFLAEQLRGTNAEVVHIDISEASIQIAKRRAEIRKLANIRWVHESLLAIPQLGLGHFDYINCSGVLHHLNDPNAGLLALSAVLKQDGALGVMLYGLYGRTGVYQMQALLGLINRDTDSHSKKLENAKSVLAALPNSNWFKRGSELYGDHVAFGDSGIFDLLLHTQDRGYTVGEIFEWFTDRNEFTLQFSDVGRGRSPYMPELLVAPGTPQFLAEVRKKPLRQQYAIAELLGGTLTMHTFFATRSIAPVAVYGDPEQVPFFFHEPLTGTEVSAFIHKNKESPLVIRHSHTGITTPVDAGKYGKFIFKYVDGKRCFEEIFALVRAEDKFRKSPPGNADLFADFRPLFDYFNSIERLLLRHRGVAVLSTG